METSSKTPAATPHFSMVIPAYNEADYLPRLLDTVDAARERYYRGAEAVEVIVADNASTDATAEIARQRGCQVVRVEKRVIAAVRNGGARAARGEILAFIDADSQIHPETFNAIEAVMNTGEAVGGASGVRAERLSPGIAAIYAIVVPVFWITGMDTGVVFCRRADFEALGGYDENKLFSEDSTFLFALRKLGRSRGQKLKRVTAVKAVTSTRKWDKHGDWHYIPVMLKGLYALFFNTRSLERFARKYWYEDR